MRYYCVKHISAFILILICLCVSAGCNNSGMEDINMKCSKCGHSLNDSAKFFGLCGTPRFGVQDKSGPNDLFILDGDRTSVDNSVMLPFIVGSWESEDGRYVLTYDEDYQITLMLDGVMMLETTADFTHLEPGGPCGMDFMLGCKELKDQEGRYHGEVDNFYFDMSDTGDTMVMNLRMDPVNFDAETIVLKLAGEWKESENNQVNQPFPDGPVDDTQHLTSQPEEEATTSFDSSSESGRMESRDSTLIWLLILAVSLILTVVVPVAAVILAIAFVLILIIAIHRTVRKRKQKE